MQKLFLKTFVNLVTGSRNQLNLTTNGAIAHSRNENHYDFHKVLMSSNHIWNYPRAYALNEMRSYKYVLSVCELSSVSPGYLQARFWVGSV